VEILGYRLDEAFERAFAIGPSFDDDALERAYEKLGHPERCPHGWPIDAAAARAESEALISLPAVAENASVKVERIAEDHSEAVEHFLEAGLAIGDTLSVTSVSERGDVTVKSPADGSPVEFDPGVARAISVTAAT
jgi:DtxR family Mn-dependent transcriptional regulator